MKLKAFLYSAIALLSITILVNLDLKKSDFSILQTSVLSVLGNLVTDQLPNSPDLAIQNVVLKKVSEPTRDFNYYKYKAIVIIENKGGLLLDSNTAIYADHNQQYKYLNNNEGGFMLDGGRHYILQNYEVLFDGKYNGEDLKFCVEIKSSKQKDSDETNNCYTVNLFEEKAKIENISIGEISYDDEISLDYSFSNFSLNQDKLEIFISNSLAVDAGEMKYAEFSTEYNVYNYYRIKNSSEIVKNKNWKLLDGILFADETDKFIYVRTTNQQTNAYAVSNVLFFPAQKELNRAEFAKLFVEKTGIKLNDKGLGIFDDVKNEDWFKPYVQTLYNYGLMGDLNSKNFNPTNSITRGEVLRVVMDYFDANLKTPKEPHFEDVQTDNYLFPYAEGLYFDGKASVFSDKLNLDFPATSDFLNYLIDGYK